MDKHFMTAALLCLAMAVPPIAAATGAELKVLAGVFPLGEEAGEFG